MRQVSLKRWYPVYLNTRRHIPYDSNIFFLVSSTCAACLPHRNLDVGTLLYSQELAHTM
jgi:hypothetical protein